MLVITRYKHEVIVIGDGDDKIEIVISDIRGDRVRVGIEAPKATEVWRKELYDAIKREEKGSE